MERSTATGILCWLTSTIYQGLVRMDKYKEKLSKYEPDKNYLSKLNIPTVGNSLEICWNLLPFEN